MSDAIAMLRKEIASARQGSAESLTALRGVLHAWASQGYPHEIILLAEALCDVRDKAACIEGELN
jgi:hypothetical protein